MSDKGTTEQLRAELAQTQVDKELAQQSNTACMQEAVVLHARLADACAAQDALAAELADARRVALSYLRMATERKSELAQAHARLSAAKGRTSELYDIVTDRNRKLTQARKELDETGSENARLAALYQDDADAVCGVLGVEWTKENEYPAVALERIGQLYAELAQARAELKDLHKTDHKFGRQTILRNRDYWYDKAVAAECECDEWHKKAQAHLATLDAAEAALSDYGLSSIYNAFDSLPDAIQQMAEHINELENANKSDRVNKHAEALDATCAALADARRVAGQWFRRTQEAELAEHVQGKAADELAQTAHTERARRREAEGRAKNAEAQLSNGHGALTAAGIPRSDASGNLSICGRVMRLRTQARQRATCAEALAQLVNEGVAMLAERLADGAQMLAAKLPFAERGLANLWRQDADDARKLAAQIREALDGNQA
jgi:hypothetical protein